MIHRSRETVSSALARVSGRSLLLGILALGATTELAAQESGSTGPDSSEATEPPVLEAENARPGNAGSAGDEADGEDAASATSNAPPAPATSPSTSARAATLDTASEDVPWRLDAALDRHLGTPEWLRFSGQLRLRGEALRAQFRALPGLERSDYFAVQRTSLRSDIDLAPLHLPLSATVELLDARHYGAGTGSVMNNTIVNPLDVLQAYIDLDPDLSRVGGEDNTLRVGRETMDLGSRRLVARNRFRNSINSFDGIHWLWRGRDDAEFDAFYTLPVQIEPRNFERAALLDNEMQWDKQRTDISFWGAFYAQDIGYERIRAEGYFYGLDESAPFTRQRQLYTPGFRLVRERRSGQFDHELESAIQFGESRLLASPTGARDLDHLAWFTHASVGYTFDAPFNPNLRLAWDYASGDRNPNDGDNGRFDTLFGARRFEYGPTGIYGAIARSNLNSPEIRLSVEPSERTDAFLAWRGVWLAEARDAWVPAGVVDRSGAAGTEVGHQFEGRIRWNVFPRSLLLEIGGALLISGRFQKDAPNGQNRDTYYAYAQMVWTF
jgi:hypothetical protein